MQENFFQNSLLKSVFLFVLLLFMDNQMRAQEIIPDSIVTLRLDYIQQKLKNEKNPADLWNYGWISTYSAATVAQGILYFTAEKNSVKEDMALGAATSFIAVTALAISPLRIGRTTHLLDSMQEATPQDRMLKLSYAESLFEDIAKRERAGRSWQTHALNGAVNLGSGLITWFGFKRTVWDGVGNFALNMLVSEIQIFTQPNQSLKDYQYYCQNIVDGQKPTAYHFKPSYYVNVSTTGIGLKIVF